MPAGRGERGVVLVQVMVLAMVLGTIAAMLIQFQYSRYVTVYRVDTAQRARAIAEAALNKRISEAFLGGSFTGAVLVNDSVFGNCTVTIEAYNWDAGSGNDYRATFDPCTNCIMTSGGSPCFY